MHRLVLFFLLVVFILIHFYSLSAQPQQGNLTFAGAAVSGTHSSPLAFADGPKVTEGVPSTVIRIKSEDEEFLETMFAPDTIPLANIPVLENALGDVVRDSVLNILDLLRLRDIVIGGQPAPSPREIIEGDLNVDDRLNDTDLDYLKDILLHRKGIPHLVSIPGGTVRGEDVKVILPPNTLDIPTVIAVRKQTKHELEGMFGIKANEFLADSIYFMAAVEMTTRGSNLSQPVELEIGMDQLPPCQYKGFNGVYAARDDHDGDGKSELIFINNMHPNDDSSRLISDTIPFITLNRIQSINGVLSEIGNGYFPGETIQLNGSGFAEGQIFLYEVLFKSVDMTDSISVPPTIIHNGEVIVRIPFLSPGNFNVSVRNIANGRMTEPLLISVNPIPAVPVGNPDSIISLFFHKVRIVLNKANMLADSLSLFEINAEAVIELKNIIDYSFTMVDSLEIVFSSDSLIEAKNTFAAYLEKTGLIDTVSTYPQVLSINGLVCQAIANTVRITKEIAVMSADGVRSLRQFCLSGRCPVCCYAAVGLFNSSAYHIVLSYFYKTIYTTVCYDEPDPKPNPDPQPPPQGGFEGTGGAFGGTDEGGNKSTHWCCINIFKYGENASCHAQPSLGAEEMMKDVRGVYLNQSASTPDRYIVGPYNWRSPLTGAIVKVANHQMPYNVVGVINEAGHCVIPHLPLNSEIRLSMYDPKTGLYDNDVATYTSSNNPSYWRRVLAIFNPDTTIYTYPLKYSEPRMDSINLNRQRVEYNLYVGPNDTSKSSNLGFHASVPLSLKLEDPQGNLIVDNTGTNCYFDKMVFHQVGTYKLRVALGMSVEPGSFTVGISHVPYPPIPYFYICGTIPYDTLYEESSPYISADPATILSSDTLAVEAGVTIEFEPGGSIHANGMLHGLATPSKPILLKPAGTPKKGKSISERSIIKVNGVAGKEDAK